MNAKTIVGLALICLVLFGAHTLTRKDQDARLNQDEQTTGTRPFMDVDFSEVNRIRIADHSATTDLVRVDGIWSVEQKHNYASDLEKLTTFVRSLPAKEVGQQMAEGEDYLEEYGLSETGEEKPISVTFENEGNETLLTLTVGARRDRGGQFVELESGDIVLLNEAFSELSANPNQWIDRSLINLPEDEVESFTVEAEEGTYTLKVNGPGEYELEDLKENETLKQYEPDRIGRALQNLQLVSVFSENEEGLEPGFEQGERFIARTQDGRIYTAHIGSVAADDPNSRYLKLEVDYMAPEAPSIDDVAIELTQKAQEEADGGPVDDDALTSEIARVHAEQQAAYDEEVGKIQKTVEEQNAAWSPWVFTIMNYNADSMTTPRENLVDVKEETANEED